MPIPRSRSGAAAPRRRGDCGGGDASHPGAHHAGRTGAHPYAIGLWGDLPYYDEQKTVGVPNLVADMNNQKLAFTAHDGDLKSGCGPCTDDGLPRAKATLNSLEAPAAFTPGDNDWTDCDRDGGSTRSSDWTSSARSSSPRRSRSASIGCARVQAKPYVENRRWTFGRVTYATLNVQGSCNNLCDVAPDPAEYAARNQAEHRLAAGRPSRRPRRSARPR